jgi:hypothetical protein
VIEPVCSGGTSSAEKILSDASNVAAKAWLPGPMAVSHCTVPAACSVQPA